MLDTWTAALANPRCPVCFGAGHYAVRREMCRCVASGVFRLCYERFREYASPDCACRATVAPPVASFPTPRGTWGIAEKEFVADFLALAESALDANEYRLFRWRYLLGADIPLIRRKLKLPPLADRGLAYKCELIEQKLGRRFATIMPYPLFPIDEYLAGTRAGEAVA